MVSYHSALLPAHECLHGPWDMEEWDRCLNDPNTQLTLALFIV
jgi:hypothetical protein